MPSNNDDSANIALELIYDKALTEWRDIHAEQANKGHCLSIPLFLKASTAYFSARPRIVFVGQETHGWWINCPKSPGSVTAAEIMDFYEREWLELYRNYKSSPYWRAMRHIAEAFQLDGLPHSFLYSNIFPADLDKKQAPIALHGVFRQWRLLPEELRILEPTYVIFLCGREYYGNLESFFGEWPREFVSTASPLVRYQPPNSNWKGFVTYHPAYLQRSNQWNILDKIIASIKEDLADVPSVQT